jgi:hypothetical protein
LEQYRRIWVAQVSNLLYRGFPNLQRVAMDSTLSRLEVGDTAG